MDIENLKKRIKALQDEQTSIDAQITFARQDIQNVINEHNNRINKMVGERNMLTGKIDILKEFLALEKPEDPQKGK